LEDGEAFVRVFLNRDGRLYKMPVLRVLRDLQDTSFVAHGIVLRDDALFMDAEDVGPDQRYRDGAGRAVGLLAATRLRAASGIASQTISYALSVGVRLSSPPAFVSRPEMRPLWRSRRHQPSATQVLTSSAIARQLVSPGLSIPNRFTRPGSLCTVGPSIRKSAAGALGPESLGRQPA
jgi:hypothetical protein